MKFFKAVSVFMLTLMFASLCIAQEENVLTRMGQKAYRGAVNLLTGWLEVPFQVKKGAERGFAGSSNPFIGGVAGFFRGIVHGIGRTAWGAVELAGFWLPNPTSNENVGVPLDANYAWEDGQPYYVFRDGIEPIANKVVRGATNGLGGILELPGQIIKGFQAGGNPVMGLWKALWYPVGRVYNGAADLATFLVPNPEDQLGEPFDEEYPWDALVEKFDSAK